MWGAVWSNKNVSHHISPVQIIFSGPFGIKKLIRVSFEYIEPLKGLPGGMKDVALNMFVF